MVTLAYGPWNVFVGLDSDNQRKVSMLVTSKGNETPASLLPPADRKEVLFFPLGFQNLAVLKLTLRIRLASKSPRSTAWQEGHSVGKLVALHFSLWRQQQLRRTSSAQHKPCYGFPRAAGGGRLSGHKGLGVRHTELSSAQLAGDRIFWQ